MPWDITEVLRLTGFSEKTRKSLAQYYARLTDTNMRVLTSSLSMPAVHIFSVSDLDNYHQQMIILNCGQNAVISYPVSPELPQLSLKLTADCFGVRGDSFPKKGNNLSCFSSIELFQILFRFWRKFNLPGQAFAPLRRAKWNSLRS